MIYFIIRFNNPESYNFGNELFKTSNCNKIVTRFLMMLNIGYWTKFGIILENKIKTLFRRWELKYKSVGGEKKSFTM